MTPPPLVYQIRLKSPSRNAAAAAAQGFDDDDEDDDDHTRGSSEEVLDDLGEEVGVLGLQDAGDAG